MTNCVRPSAYFVGKGSGRRTKNPPTLAVGSVKISEKYFDLCGDDPELSFRKNRRPHLLVLSLKYKGRTSLFAVPLRSNIPSVESKELYFALPRSGNHHGIHYIKMFPITKKYQEKFWIGNNSSYILYQNIVNKHE